MPDLVAVGLVVVAALTTLGLVSDLAGPVGRGLATAAGYLTGLARFGVPLLLAAVALLELRARSAAPEGDVARAPRSRTDDDLTDPRPAPGPDAGWRLGAGAALVAAAAVAGLHLAGGRPSLDGPSEALRDAGGALGALVGGPLAAAAGVVGAVIVVLGIAALGATLLSGVPVRVAGRALAGWARAASSWLRAVVRRAWQDGLGGSVPDPALTATGDAPADGLGLGDGPTAIHGEGSGRLVSAQLYDFDLDLRPDPASRPSGAATGDADDDDDPDAGAEPGEQLAIDLGPAHRAGSWKLPSHGLLQRSRNQGIDERLVEEAGKVLEATLHQHGVDAHVVGTTIGPTVTRYEVQLAPGVKVNRVTSLGHDIAYAMASADVRILAPIPGRSAIGVEVPNKQRQLVTLGDIFATPEAKQPHHPLEVPLGRDIAGRPVLLNLATLPHVLIAGATGAGKSSCINVVVTSLLMRNTPEQLRLILVDPKRVELGAYADVPHLLTPVVTNPKKAANALDWAVREMDLRYEALAEVGVRDITGYNAAFDRGELPTRDDPDPMTGKGYDRLPFVVIVVDELNDLMMVAARDVEASICRIAQMARAVGIHLVIATQRPSVDVITGVIKANVPSRLAFSVSSLADSRVILDQAGAEKLVGQGDLLAVTPDSSRGRRIQCAWVDETCVRKVAAHWKRQAGGTTYVAGVADDGASGRSGGDVGDDGDELLDEAMELVVRSGLGSTSMLQRKLRVGFSRAGRLMDLLERRGIVGPSEGSKARAVLMTVEELEDLRARVD